MIVSCFVAVASACSSDDDASSDVTSSQPAANPASTFGTASPTEMEAVPVAVTPALPGEGNPMTSPGMLPVGTPVTPEPPANPGEPAPPEMPVDPEPGMPAPPASTGEPEMPEPDPEPEPVEPEPEPVDYPDDPFGDNPESVTVQNNIGWIEGPTWVPDEGGFIYNLTDRDTPDIHRIWRPGQDGTEEYWRVPGSNHGAIWSEGLIFMTNREPGRIGYIDPSQDPLEETVIRDGLGRPNDLDRFSDGSVFFSDWPRGDTGVYRLQMNGDMEEVISAGQIGSPNGIAFTADCTRLYVANTGNAVVAFDVDAEGNLSNQRNHVSSGSVNGIAVDLAGNLYVPNGNGVRAYNLDGDQVGDWGGAADGVVNMTFGGEDGRWLLTTNKDSVSAVRTQIPGGECNGLGTQRSAE